jgi:hypothetical protein
MQLDRYDVITHITSRPTEIILLDKKTTAKKGFE